MVQARLGLQLSWWDRSDRRCCPSNYSSHLPWCRGGVVVLDADGIPRNLVAVRDKLVGDRAYRHQDPGIHHVRNRIVQYLDVLVYPGAEEAREANPPVPCVKAVVLDGDAVVAECKEDT